MAYYTCKGKGGRYCVLANAMPAGTSKDRGPVIVYQDIESGDVYYRTLDDFKERMELVGVAENAQK